ncbi:MAG: HNH endonuclease [Planctomycetales bacterium]|nr:HNH endonuclease [Planctomycetales bacterium]MCA9166710.1 HNH endonuclease [Planctomycetales bacterium]
MRAFVRKRALDRCEYCLFPEASAYHSFHVEHIVPLKHGGDDAQSNLALACRNCNLHKGSNLSGIDPTTGQVISLFHPRQQSWHSHFCFHGFRVEGKTATGRATIHVLCMNDPDQIAMREAVGLRKP